jgi:hypothetical protein
MALSIHADTAKIQSQRMRLFDFPRPGMGKIDSVTARFIY